MRSQGFGLAALRQLLFWRGVLALTLSLVAVRWPVETLLFAMVAAGAAFLVMGAFDSVVALRLRSSFRFWWVALAHGLACVLFGVVTLAVPALALRAAMILAALWLLAYGGLALVAALRLRQAGMPWVMPALWGAINALFAAVLLLYPVPSVTIVLYAGAGYVAALGAAHLAAAFALRRAGALAAA